MAVEEHFLGGPHTSVDVIHVFGDHGDKYQNYRNCCTSVCTLLLGPFGTRPHFRNKSEIHHEILAQAIILFISVIVLLRNT